MAKKNVVQQLIESGIEFGEMSRKQAEKAVKNFVKAGEVRRSDAEATVQALIDRGRETTQRLTDLVQQEVARQLGWMANRIDDLEDQLETFVSRLSASGGARRTRAASTAKRASAPRKSAAR